jgi:hypothetical protein
MVDFEFVPLMVGGPRDGLRLDRRTGTPPQGFLFVEGDDGPPGWVDQRPAGPTVGYDTYARGAQSAGVEIEYDFVEPA